MEAALYGSFLPIPPEHIFPQIDASEYAREKAPGAIIARKERIVLNEGRERIRLEVTNNGDRPIQVSFTGSALTGSYSHIWSRLGPTIISSKQMPR